MLPALYALSMAILLLYSLNLLWMALRFTRGERLLPGKVPDPEAAGDLAVCPEVTVQLPLYNEAHVASRLIDACAALEYPRHRLEIQVLDDSTDETASLVAERVQKWRARGVDILHIRRDVRTGFKAGALQNGLRLARGEFIALFDADFVPRSDFLQRLLPLFDPPDVGMVQARWGHLNPAFSLLTRIQAFGLDAHFAVEQGVRSGAGLFINFNGTAGVWRRACIEAAGGWTSDTLTEDLDLSYRAQLAGWRFRYLDAHEVPAELPVEMSALRQQQFRWAKGAAETAKKLLARLWRSSRPFSIKLEGTFHLTAHFVFPFVLLAALLHAPLAWQRAVGHGPGAWYFALMSVGLLGFVGFFLVHLFAQRHLYGDWAGRMRHFPLFMAGTMGLSLSNTFAIAQALAGRKTPFVRTPKYRVGEGAPSWWGSRYRTRALPAVAWGEAVLALYCLGGLVLTLWLRAWEAVPFQAIFLLGFGLLTYWNVRQRVGR